MFRKDKLKMGEALAMSCKVNYGVEYISFKLNCSQVSPELYLLQAEQPQLLQPAHIREELQPHLYGPPLDLLHVFLTLGAHRNECNTPCRVS